MSETDSRGRDGAGRADPVRELLRLAGPRPQVVEERAARVKRAVAAEWRRGQREAAPRGHRPTGFWRRSFWQPALAAAALLAVAAGVATWMRREAASPSPGTVVAAVETACGAGDRREPATGPPALLAVGNEVAAGATLVTAAEGCLALRLAGEGPSLRLDRGSRVAIESARRLRLERGAAYVDSAGSAGAVVIDTPWGPVEEIGTQFEVRRTGDGLRIRVREGAVRLGGEEGGEVAGASTELLVDGAGQVRRRWIDPAGPEWDWVLAAAPAFQLEGRSVAALAEWVARETGRPLRWESPQAARRGGEVRLHGSLAGLRPDEALAAVLPTTRFSHRIAEGELRLEARGD